MRTYSYEKMLGAVGRVLDLADARGFAIRDAEDGMTLELVGADALPDAKVELSLGDVAELVEWNGDVPTLPTFGRGIAGDEGTLTNFLERHALVGAGR